MITKETLSKIEVYTFKIFWWAIVFIYSIAYMLYLPKTVFGTSQFNILFWGVNYATGLYIILKAGGLLR